MFLETTAKRGELLDGMCGDTGAASTRRQHCSCCGSRRRLRLCSLRGASFLGEGGRDDSQAKNLVGDSKSLHDLDRNHEEAGAMLRQYDFGSQVRLSVFQEASLSCN